MIICKKDIKIRYLIKGYRRVGEKFTDTMEKSRLDLRHEYKRKSVNSRKKQEEIINSVVNGYLPNTIYWLINNDKDNEHNYEVIVGKQRCILCVKSPTLKWVNIDHIVSWLKSGKKILDNCQLLCLKCNFQKGAKNVK